jgi:hypothetical protein
VALDPNQTVKKAVAVSGSSNSNQKPIKIILVDTAGNAVQPLVKQAAQADSVASTVGGLVTDFNALLAKLRLAGVIS